jgi:photosystem II stability/assembly factor-like uncharacterized protein
VDEDLPSSKRSRRAIPLIASALAAVVVVGLLYVRTVGPELIGSATSQPIPTMSGPYSVTYDFISPSVGWALVLDYSSFSSNFWIMKTADGAGHWERMYQGQAEGGNTYIHFFDPLHGLAYAGSRLYSTADGGRTWQFVFTPTGERFAGPLVTFASPARGWALDFEGGAGRLYSTRDGGATWRQLPSDLPPAAVFAPLNEGQPTIFLDTGEGWLGAGFLDSPVAYRTTDGGRSWAQVAIHTPQQGGRYQTAVRLVPGGKVLAFVIDDGPLLRLSAFVSSDRGNSWQELTRPPWLAGLDDVSFADSRHWWVARAGTAYKTDDAGHTWQPISGEGLPREWNLQAAHLTDADHAWWPMTSWAHSTDSALAMTSDGGAHWKMVNPPQPE